MRDIKVILAVLLSSISLAQQPYVDFTKVRASFTIAPDLGLVEGKASYEFKILNAVDSVAIDAKDISINGQLTHASNKRLSYSYNGQKIWIKHAFKRDSIYEFNLQYKAKPKKALYFLQRNNHWNIWTQGQGQYTSNWLPSFDTVKEKAIFDLTFNFESDYRIISNGRQMPGDAVTDVKHQSVRYKMELPMSSYLVAFVIGQYESITETSKSGVPLEYYYKPEHILKVEPTYRYTKQLFDFLEEEIGVPYPWQNYKQVPVSDFLYSGMENTSLTVFSDAFVVDSIAFRDKNYVTVNAHEMAHQWFGNLVTANSGAHHWLQEGFATYYALLAERSIFGDQHYYWQLYENAQALMAQERASENTALLDPNSSSITFYKKGAWALHALRAQVGDSAFKAGVKAYVQKHQFATVTTSDFISEVESASGQDLTTFVDDWLVSKTFPQQTIVECLNQSTFLQEYFMVDCEVYTSKCKEYLSSYISDKAKVKVIRQIPDKIDGSAFQNNVEVRQAIATHVDKIPVELKSRYETLLKDASYITVENALYHLWVNFPLERSNYLQATKTIKGFSDYNVRLLWLALHLNTVEYQPEKKGAILNELVGYSLSEHPFELRMNAFSYLKLLDAFEAHSLKSLIDATGHHNWRFSKYAKDLLIQLKQNDLYEAIINTFEKK